MEEFVKLFAVITAIATGGGVGFVVIAMGLAAAKRLERGGRAPEALEPDATTERLARLEREVGELHERLDFAERLLAQTREPDRLPGTLH